MTAVTEQLKVLADLLEKGLLTREQFEEQRDRILAQSSGAPAAPQVSASAIPPGPGAGGERAGVPVSPPPRPRPTQGERSGGGIPLAAIGIGMAIVFGLAVLVIVVAGAVFMVARGTPSDSRDRSARSAERGDAEDEGEPDDTVRAVEIVTTTGGTGTDGSGAPASPSAGIPLPTANPGAIIEEPLLDATAEAHFAGHPDALADYRRAVSFVNRRNTRAARPILDDLATAASGRDYEEEVSLLRAADLVNQSLPDDAILALTAWKLDHPDSRLVPIAFVWEGKAHVAKGRAAAKADDIARARPSFERAEEAFTSVIEQYPDDANACGEALFNLGSVYGLLEQPARQREAYDQLVAIYRDHPLAPRALYTAANAAWADEDHETATRYFEKLRDTYPDDGLSKRANRNIKALAVLGQPASELVVDHWIGSEATLESQRGKLVLVVFWNEWCPHCKRELPKLQATWESYRDRGLSVVLVTKHTKSQTDAKVKSLLEEKGVTLPCAVEPSGYPSTKAYAISGVPAAALVDREGTIVWRNHPARMTEEQLEDFLDR